ncbi:MAG: DHH family phosphoesterase [Thermoplasmata archaeon]
MYLILGAGDVGKTVALSLHLNNVPVAVIDRDEAKVAFLKSKGIKAYTADLSGVSPDLLEEEPEIVLFLTRNAAATTKGINHVREIWPKAYIMARAVDKITLEVVKEASPDQIIESSEIVADGVLRILENYRMKKKALELLNIIDKVKNGTVGIFTHDNPDPDALASAMALQHVCRVRNVNSKIYYSGRISHRQNKMMVKLLNLELTHLSKDEDVLKVINTLSKIALVDVAVPGANNILPNNIVPNIIIDHHSTSKELIVGAEFVDINPNVGSTCSILTQYLKFLNIPVTKELASALIFGQRTDTAGFTRKISTIDMQVAAFLNSLSDKDILNTFETPPMPSVVMNIYGKAIINREIKNDVVISCVGRLSEEYRDALPQAAEFLLNEEKILTVLIFGIIDNQVHFCCRNKNPNIHAGELLKYAFQELGGSAGGHQDSAAGRIPLGHIDSTLSENDLITITKWEVRNRLFEALNKFGTSNNKHNVEKT